MTTIFIGGSRRISRLSPSVMARLDTIMAKEFPVIIGDASGADTAVQRYLFDKAYGQVEIFCSGSVCRNNVGQWRMRPIQASPHEKGFQFYATKDRAMAHKADFGLMLWDGKSVGTLLNVLRLLNQNKKTILYSALEKNFVEFRSEDDWNSFVTSLDSKIQDDMEQRAHPEDKSSNFSR
jgi:hypothetical protein